MLRIIGDLKLLVIIVWQPIYTTIESNCVRFYLKLQFRIYYDSSTWILFLSALLVLMVSHRDHCLVLTCQLLRLLTHCVWYGMVSHWLSGHYILPEIPSAT